MGYTTKFKGRLEIVLPQYMSIDNFIPIKNFVNSLAKTRRVKRDLSKIADSDGLVNGVKIENFGVDGEFYTNPDSNNFGQEADASIISYNRPPKTQPGLWLQWIVTQENNNFFIEWDKGEKFYNYIEWLKYLINSIFTPKDIIINGKIIFSGEDIEDSGIIIVDKSNVSIEYF